MLANFLSCAIMTSSQIERTKMVALSTLLRTATRPQHEHAETRSFVTDLMGGSLSRSAYLDLARQHYVIYSNLEGTAERFADDPFVGRFVMPEVLRLDAIRADLRTLCGEDLRSGIVPMAATDELASRLAATTHTAQFRTAGYIRFLGDLSGGQAIAAMLKPHYGLTAGELPFYKFSVGKIKDFKDRYPEMMDGVPFSPDQAQEAAA